MNEPAALSNAVEITPALDPTRPNAMEIDLSAIEYNLNIIRLLAGPGVRVIPCVKCEAFGLALVAVAHRLAQLGVGTLFCGSFADAKILREEGLSETDLVVFGGALPDGIPALLDLGLIPTVHNMEIADAVSASAAWPARVYVKVDSGRGRLGFSIRTAREAILAVARKPNIIVEGIYTHLPFADAEGARWAQERTELFDELIDDLRRNGLSAPVTQARSSSGILFGIRDRCTAVAPGSILYGKNSLPDGMVDFPNFRPLLSSIRSRLIHISSDAADKTPGTFGRYAHRVRGATGVIPFGRKEGFPVARAGKENFVIVSGVKAPVLSVSSEHAVLDLSVVPDPQVGDDVIIVGTSGEFEITLADLARWQDVNMNDTLLMMRGRVPQITRG